MKKILLFLALVIILFSVSCGSDKEVTSDNGTKPVVLRIWGGVPPEAGYQTMLDLFNEEFKDEGIQAEYVRYVNDVNGNLKLEITLLAGLRPVFPWMSAVSLVSLYAFFQLFSTH